MPVQLGRVVDGNCSVLITTRDCKTGQIVSEEYLTLERKIPSAPKRKKVLPLEFSTTDGGITLALPDGSKLTSADPYTLLYRAATDNDTDLTFRNTMKPWYSQKEEILSVKTENPGVRNEVRISNPKAKFLVTDRYVDTEEGILVTSELRCESGRVNIPRFGKCFRLDESFDDVTGMKKLQQKPTLTLVVSPLPILWIRLHTMLLKSSQASITPWAVSKSTAPHR